jgi:hypothetical protein
MTDVRFRYSLITADSWAVPDTLIDLLHNLSTCYGRWPLRTLIHPPFILTSDSFIYRHTQLSFFHKFQQFPHSDYRSHIAFFCDASSEWSSHAKRVTVLPLLKRQRKPTILKWQKVHSSKIFHIFQRCERHFWSNISNLTFTLQIAEL